MYNLGTVSHMFREFAITVRTVYQSGLQRPTDLPKDSSLRPAVVALFCTEELGVIEVEDRSYRLLFQFLLYFIDGFKFLTYS